MSLESIPSDLVGRSTAGSFLLQKFGLKSQRSV